MSDDSYEYSYDYKYSSDVEPVLQSSPVLKGGRNVLRAKVSYDTLADKKKAAIMDLLCRWWYVLPPWPPLDWDYSEQLQKNRMRLTPLDEWEEADEVNEEGFAKCYQVQHCEGVYRLDNTDLVDLRPTDGKPCYDGLSQYSLQEITSMLTIAYENQLEDIKHSLYTATDKSHLDDVVRVCEKKLQYYKGLSNGKF